MFKVIDSQRILQQSVSVNRGWTYQVTSVLTQQKRTVTDFAETSGRFKLKIDYVNSVKDIKKELVEDRLKHQGYVFFRGASITDSQKLSDLRHVLFQKDVYDYLKHGGIYSGTRKNKVEGVYDFVNVSTPFWDMPAHNDLAYRPAMVGRVCIAQFKPSTKGGCTPLYDTRLLWLPMVDRFYDLMVELHQYGLIYTKNLPDGNNKEKANLWMETADIPSWQSNFPNMTKEEITRTVEAKGEKVEWMGDGTLKISWKLPAFRRHPYTGEYFFCNQLLGFEARNFWQWPGRPFDSLKYEDCPTHVIVGNGRELTDDEYNGILDIHHSHAIRGKWEPGDAVLMDNVRISHSRDPYEGERVLAIMWGDTIDPEK